MACRYNWDNTASRLFIIKMHNAKQASMILIIVYAKNVNDGPGSSTQGVEWKVNELMNGNNVLQSFLWGLLKFRTLPRFNLPLLLMRIYSSWFFPLVNYPVYLNRA